MSSILEDYYKHLDKFEGKVANNPKDPGGLTNRGVTIGTWGAYAKRFGWDPSANGLLNMTETQWRTIINDFWKKAGGDDLKDKRLSVMLTELRWGGGDGRVKWVLEHMLGKSISVPISKDTVSELNKKPAGQVFDDMHKWRVEYYDRIIQQNPKLAEFRKGWLRRANEFYDTFKKKIQ